MATSLALAGGENQQQEFSGQRLIFFNFCVRALQR
jgi:hypothetical protein